MQSTTTHAVIKQLKVLFARYGVQKNKVCLERNNIGLIAQKEDVDGSSILLDKIIEYCLLNTFDYSDDKNLPTLEELKEKFYFSKKDLKLNVIHYFSKEWNIDLISSCGLILADIQNHELVPLIDNLKATKRNNQVLEAKEKRSEYIPNAKRIALHLEFGKKIVAEIEKIISRDPVDLETSLYWAAGNVQNRLIYTSLLFELNKHPYQTEVVNKWFTQKISTEKRNDPNQNSTTDINMFNSTSNGEGPGIKAFLDDVKDKNKDCSLYFHGTTQAAAQSILESGIILEKGKEENDFSNGKGFYVAEKYSTADEIVNGSGAIVVFKIPNSMVDALLEKGLYLHTDQDEQTWKDIILYCRGHSNRTRTTKSLLKDKNFVRGPMCTNPEALKPDKNKKRNSHRTNQIQPEGFSEREMQICVRKHDYSTRFGSIENICCVIFYAKYS